MVEAPERIWATFEPHESGKGHPRTYATASKTKGQEYIRADIAVERAERALAERAGGRWQVKDYADGWINFDSAEEAIAEVAAMGGALIRPLTTEPAAPEGRQDNERIRCEMDEILRKQSERDIPFAPSTRPRRTGGDG